MYEQRPSRDEPRSSAWPNEAFKREPDRMIDALLPDGANRPALFDGSGCQRSTGTEPE
ncbi:hypothetical protein [Streptomyces sp. GSL17-111]|uniref:hypothetical protein n=1 Tax=Streptomyces sp. GSL17-111 TaxID=3121596 RepID=UPI0030F3D53B